MPGVAGFPFLAWKQVGGVLTTGFLLGVPAAISTLGLNQPFHIVVDGDVVIVVVVIVIFSFFSPSSPVFSLSACQPVSSPARFPSLVTRTIQSRVEGRWPGSSPGPVAACHVDHGSRSHTRILPCTHTHTEPVTHAPQGKKKNRANSRPLPPHTTRCDSLTSLIDMCYNAALQTRQGQKERRSKEGRADGDLSVKPPGNGEGGGITRGGACIGASWCAMHAARSLRLGYIQFPGRGPRRSRVRYLSAMVHHWAWKSRRPSISRPRASPPGPSLLGIPYMFLPPRAARTRASQDQSGRGAVVGQRERPSEGLRTGLPCKQLTATN